MRKIIAFLSTAVLASAAFLPQNSTEALTKLRASGSYNYTAEDVRNLQDFLLAKPTDTDLGEKPYDMNNDGRWDVFDLCLMKRQITSPKLHLTVSGRKLTGLLADSTAAKELAEKLRTKPVTIRLNEYGGFEKVGRLPWALTRTDKQTVTEAGDIMLYQGDQMTIFYDSNSWSYTKLGHIDGMTAGELSKLFGSGDVSIELSVS